MSIKRLLNGANLPYSETFNGELPETKASLENILKNEEFHNKISELSQSGKDTEHFKLQEERKKVSKIIEGYIEKNGDNGYFSNLLKKIKGL